MQENSKTFVCPNCEHINAYKLNLPIAIACQSCDLSYLVDENNSTKVLNSEYRKLNTISVLNLQTKGIYKGESFQLIGFIRSVNTLSISNEWLMYFESGTYKWLTESAFRYFVFDPKAIPMSSNAIKGNTPGNTVLINSKAYVLVEITKQIDFYSSGEIPADSYNDNSFFKYELVAKDSSDFASVCIYSQAQIDAYLGDKVQLEDLHLEKATTFKDWI
jgi:hypothetical protein